MSRAIPRGFGGGRVGPRLAISLAVAAGFLLTAASASAAIDAHVTLDGSGFGTVTEAEPAISGTPPIECGNVPGEEKAACDTEAFVPHPVWGPTLSLGHEAAPGSVFAGWTVEEGTALFCAPLADNCKAATRNETLELKVKATFEEAVQLSLVKGGHAPGGTVSSEPGGIECGTACEAQTGDFLEGAPVELVAEAALGYAFAGWLGCAYTGPGTCEVTPEGPRTEVFAAFVKDGVDGEDGADGADGEDGEGGVDGEDGADGGDGANGAAGPIGPAGALGPAGIQGAPGPRGAAGAQGPRGKRGPAGKVVCQVNRNGKRVRVNCKVRRQQSSGKDGKGKRRRIGWRLMRGGNAHLRGSTRVRTNGRAAVRLNTRKLSRSSELPPGRYVLRLQGRKGGVRVVLK